MGWGRGAGQHRLGIHQIAARAIDNHIEFATLKGSELAGFRAITTEMLHPFGHGLAAAGEQA